AVPPPLPADGLPATERPAAELPLVARAGTDVLNIRVLGALGAAVGDRPVRLTLAKSAEVLVWLAWHGAGSSAEIMNDLWSGSRERRHHEYFRVAVRKLRASLVQAAGWSFDPVPYDGQRYRLHPDVQVHLDARTFVTLIGKGRVEDALALYLGEPLPGLEGDWAQDLREQLRSAMLAAVLDAANTPGEVALTGLRRAAQLEPTAETVNLALIEALLPDRPRDALGAFRTYARHLRTQLDEDVPGAVVRRLKARGLPLT
ncbi:BTAD domain-containing putative transcriptional regulator, partial [Deinococcus sp. 23YEL01]|uniref:AfsR/SARP family transcriptional regulator n=1 Tax=Deinococcus sp. 23YEL01 TaxID=2745871 RepID=UPI00271496C7